jgi:hypothetical protein
MYRYFPLITGLFLGAVSIIMGQIPRNIAQFTGMTMIGNEMGYLWSALITAWVYSKNWKKSFITSAITLITATFTYYFVLIVLSNFETMRYLMRLGESAANQFRGLIYWTIFSIIIAVLAATAIWMAKHAKSKMLNYGISLIAYIGMLGVLYYFRGRQAIGWYGMKMAEEGYIRSLNYFIGLLYEIGFAFVVTTVLVGIGFRSIVKEKKRVNMSTSDSGA